MSTSQSLAGTIGRWEIALVLLAFLFGIETLQTFNYFGQFPKDPRRLKILVAGIWLLELAHTISAFLTVYAITVTFYGQPQHIERPALSLVLMLLFHSVLAAVVPTFFAFRLRILLMRWPIIILCCLLNFLRLLSNLAIAVEFWKNEDLVVIETQLAWLVITATAVGPVVDIITAASLCYSLWHFKQSEFKRTNWMVDKIIVWTVVTWTIFYAIQAKLFSNSLLASLNGRKRLRSNSSGSKQLPNGSSHVIAFDSGAPTRDTVGLILVSFFKPVDD
ncbi:hypothetical protein FB451DRAFT_1410101 [Mycena latifolia]|nr:hypothetical protein FB451DRAFT_1410101 [Mycena latifolia]